MTTKKENELTAEAAPKAAKSASSTPSKIVVNSNHTHNWHQHGFQIKKGRNVVDPSTIPPEAKKRLEALARHKDRHVTIEKYNPADEVEAEDGGASLLDQMVADGDANHANELRQLLGAGGAGVGPITDSAHIGAGMFSKHVDEGDDFETAKAKLPLNAQADAEKAEREHDTALKGEELKHGKSESHAPPADHAKKHK